MPLSKQSRGEPHDAPRTSKPRRQQRLYLMFDDWELGYSIRELNMWNAGAEQRRLPPPFIRLEAIHGRPEFFASVGTKILMTNPVPKYDALAPIGILPIIDVRSRGVNLAPGELYPEHPIYIPVGDSKLFALDINTFKMLSMKPLCPPLMEIEYSDRSMEWSWHDLPMPTFERMDVTSYAVDADGGTILTSTNCATFAFDIANSKWKQPSNCSLPFSGRANFVPGLNVFVGLPKDVDYFGHLCFCRLLGDDKHDVWFSKENLSSKDPDESHVGFSLVYLGEMRFCLVECVSKGEAEAEKWLEEWGKGKLHQAAELEKWEPCPLISSRCVLTTLSLSSGMNGNLTAAKTAVQCYKVPVEASYNVNPVAFWL
ncbi:unnamed protein product [Urochloa decumbens]|uniref:Uncharacterized protein n=1 Tax=Urochloa decumbens TaxID=240449 RepID=A0ABC8YYH0_9POAL